jgi:hypothetical protein
MSRPLARTELLLLAAMRAWGDARAAGRRPSQVVGAVFAAKTSRQAAAFFSAWMQALEAGARRPIRLSCASCAGPSADEARLLHAYGVAPLDLQLSCGLLQPLLRDAEAAAVLGRSLNVALAAAGWPCPARVNPWGEPSATLH